MADGVVLNSGSGGVTAATDDCGAPGHTQIIKLAVSANGDATVSPNDATYGLGVDVKRAPSGATAALTNVSASGASATALSANSARLSVAFINDADVPCYLKYGTTASATSYTRKLFPGEQWEPRWNYTGRIDVIWDTSPTGALRVTEMSA